MTNEDIKSIALVSGFRLKEQADGTQDLNPYVYDFARRLMRLQNGRIISSMSDFYIGSSAESGLSMLDKCMECIESHINEIRNSEEKR